MYRVEFNTGDDNWDDNPIEINCNTLEEVRETITNEIWPTHEGAEFTDEKIEFLRENGFVYDDDETIWCVTEI